MQFCFVEDHLPTKTFESMSAPGSIDKMNVHHLELFYYVAKYEGITEAVRKMPYGIQQPAVSGQLLQLEKSLGVKLFHRRPFALTAEGEKLYDFAYPFYSQIGQIEAELREETQTHLRLAASSMVLRTHLPALLESMKVQNQDLRLTLREVAPEGVKRELVEQRADIGITALHPALGGGLQVETLLTLPLVLKVPKRWGISRFDDLIKDDGMGRLVGKVPLIALPESELAMMHFQAGLRERGVQWESDVEVGSLDMVDGYVRSGFGAGLSVQVPAKEADEGFDEIVLDGFAPLEIALVWQGKLRPMAEWFRVEVTGFAERLRGGVVAPPR